MPPDDDSFAGIDPVMMKAMISDLADASSVVVAEVPRLLDDFGRARLETRHLTTLKGVADWIDGEVPMLRRRQSMAEQISRENNQYGFNGNMVESEGTGVFKTKEEAQAKAKELAAKFSEHPPSLDDATWTELRKYQNDPDFAEAFVKELGPQKLLGLLKYNRFDSKGNEPKERPEIIAALMATASHRGVIDDAFLKKFHENGVDGPDLSMIALLIKTGTWNKDTLVKIGEKALAADQLGGGNYRTAEILEAIARNPLAANELYTRNFDRIQSIVYGKAVGFVNMDDPKIGDKLGVFMQAATVDAKEAYERMRPPGDDKWQNPADVLTRRLLEDIHKNGKTVTPWSGVKHAYVGIIETYYDDLQGSVTSMVPEYWKTKDGDPGRNGIELPPEVWATITEQAMSDPKNAAELNVFFAAKYKESSERVNTGELPDAKDANNLSTFQNGQLKGWFLKRLDAAKALSKKETDDYNKEVDKWVGLFVDGAVTVGTGAANPAAGVTSGAAAATAAGGVMKGFVQGLGTDQAKKWIGDVFHKKDVKYDVDTDWASQSTAYQSAASDLYNSGKIKPVKDPDVTWTGDPQLYEELYGGKFTENGKVKSMDELKKDPKAMRAFEEWLQDPAVQNATWNQFSADAQGQSGAN